MIPNFNTYIRMSSVSGRWLVEKAMRTIEAIEDRWAGEAAGYALAGNPHRAGYIEAMIGLVRR